MSDPRSAGGPVEWPQYYSTQVSSWYKNAKGRVSQNWPFALVDYWNLTQKPDPDDYELL